MVYVHNGANGAKESNNLSQVKTGKPYGPSKLTNLRAISAITASNPLLKKDLGNGAKDKSFAPLRPVRRNRSPLELVLLAWSEQHWCAPLDALMDRWGDWEYEKKCLGSIFRKIVHQSPTWVYRLAESCPGELLALAPYIGDVDMPWGKMPGALGWAGWIWAIQNTEGI